MLKSVLMAASRLPSSQIPTPLKPQYSLVPLNAALGNTLNPRFSLARKFVENVRLSERAADRQRRQVARAGGGALAGCRICLRDVAALDLGVDAAHDAFGHRVCGREHGEVDLEHGAKRVVMAPQCGQQFGRYLRKIFLRCL